jgi:nucleoid-associated protein YgaU
MVRKDVKLGFIIGGVLLAVVVVYALVATGDKKKGAQLTKVDPTQVTSSDPAVDSNAQANDKSNTQAEPPPPVTPEKPVAEKNDTETGAPTSQAVATAKQNDPFESNAKEDDRWLMALNHGQMPTLMSTTQTPTQAQNESTAKQEPVQITPTTRPSDEEAEQNNMIADPAPIEPKNNQKAQKSDKHEARLASSTTQPSGNMNTHVVQRGETLSKISDAAYGSAAYWPHILRANPGLIDKKLRPGMTINLPPASEVKAEGTPTGSGTTNTAIASNAPSTQPSIDPKTEYRVVTGDSLQKISTKLYGKAELWEKIYDANKDKIGTDPAKLKLNTVLKLPQAPTVTASVH